MWFTIVPHKDGARAHHLEVVLSPAHFGSPSVSGPFIRADEDLGRPREVVDIIEVYIVDFFCIVFQVQYNSAYPLVLDETPDADYVHILPRTQRVILCA